jgi:hypothetical protein
MRLYAHRAGQLDPEAIEIADGATLVDALDLEDGEVALLEDADEPLDATVTPEAAGVGDRAHVFRGPPRRIAVEVVFNAEQHAQSFSPSTRLDRVFRWATGKQAFDLSEADAAEHTLALPDGSIPPSDAHLGSLDEATPGRLRFSLIPKHRFEG